MKNHKFFSLLVLLFATCSSLLAQPKTIAISYFDNTSGLEQYNPLSKGLADMLITDLSNVKSIQIVEREKLENLLKEIDLGEGKFIDPNTAQKLGKGLGAGYMLTGSYLIMGETMRIDARLVDVGTGEIAMAEEITGEKNTFFTLEKDLVNKLVATLNLELSRSEERKIKKIQTESFGAFSAYSSGLNAYDKGSVDEAKAFMEKATNLDTNFDRAYEQLDLIDEKLEVIKGKVDEVSQQISDVDKKISSGFDNLEETIRDMMNPSDFIKLNEQFLSEIEKNKSTVSYLNAKKLFDNDFTKKIDESNKELMLQISDIVPKSDLGYFAKGYFEKINGNNVKAVTYLDTVLSINPNFSWAYILRGLSKTWVSGFGRSMSADQYNSIRNDFEVALKLEPKNSIFYYLSATRHYVNNKSIDLNRAIELNPFFTEAIIHRAWVSDLLAYRTKDESYLQIKCNDLIEYFQLINKNPQLKVENFEVNPGLIRTPKFFIESPYSRDCFDQINKPSITEHYWNSIDNDQSDTTKYVFKLILDGIGENVGYCIEKFIVFGKKGEEISIKDNYYLVGSKYQSDFDISVVVLFEKKIFHSQRRLLRSIDKAAVTLTAETLYLPRNLIDTHCGTDTKELYLIADKIDLGW